LTQYNIVSGASLVAGQPEDISIVLANLQAIASVLNGNLDNANLHANAAIVPSKLQGYPSDATKALLGDGNWGTVTSPRLGESSLSITDWNLALKNGWYISDAATAANKPTPVTTGWLIGEVQNLNDSWITQRVWEAFIANGPVWERRRLNDVWGPWFMLPGILERKDSDLQIVSSAAEASLYSATAHSGSTGWTIPANIGVNRLLRLTMRGDALYNNSDADNGTMRIRVGGTSLGQTWDMFGPGGPSATRDEWWAQLHVAIDAAANVQRGWGWYQSSRTSQPTGIYVYGTAGAVDTTAPWKFDATFQWTAASGNNAFRILWSILELL
jgi:hypothetical protein